MVLIFVYWTASSSYLVVAALRTRPSSVFFLDRPIASLAQWTEHRNIYKKGGGISVENIIYNSYVMDNNFV